MFLEFSDLQWHRQGSAFPGTAVGTSWLLLWLTGIAARWSAAGILVVKTNMALSLVFAGTALLLLAPAAARPLRRRLGLLGAAVVFLIGALTLSQHLFGYDLGMDQLLASEPPGSAAPTSPNRIGPPGSLSLVLLGAGLLLLPSRRSVITPWLGLAVCITDLVPVVGFLYGITDFYRPPQMTGNSWWSVLALVSLGLGLLVARPAQGPAAQFLRDDPGGVLLRRLWPAGVIIPLILGFLKVLGRDRELFGTASGTGMLVIALVLVFSVLLWTSAAHLSRTSSAQARAEEKLRARVLTAS